MGVFLSNMKPIVLRAGKHYKNTIKAINDDKIKKDQKQMEDFIKKNGVKKIPFGVRAEYEEHSFCGKQGRKKSAPNKKYVDK
jgi:hypothetical protein